MKITNNYYPQAYKDRYKYFFKDKFSVNKHTLIPRKETEFLVEKALSLIPSYTPINIADVGTGTGCIAISILQSLEEAWEHYNQVHVYGYDISINALRVAQMNKVNILHTSQDHLHLTHHNLLTNIETKFNIICANLPYIPHERIPLLSLSVQAEPHIALDGGKDGLVLINKLIQQSKNNLLAHGHLLLEADPEQMDALTRLCLKQFPHAHIEIIRDYSGNNRICVCSVR